MRKNNYVNHRDTRTAKDSGQKSQSLKQPNDSARHANAQPPTQKGSDAQSNPSGSHNKSARNQQTGAPDIKASKTPIIKPMRTIVRTTQLTQLDTKKVLDDIYEKKIYQLDHHEEIEEVNFILMKFKQRKCSNFCRTREDKCKCGLPQERHEKEKPMHSIEWTPQNDTEAIQTVDFGNLEHKDTKRTGKYVRIDDFMEDMDAIYDLLTKHWKLPEPQLVISICGGNQTAETEDIMKLFDTTEIKNTWIITDGMYTKSGHSATQRVGEVKDLADTDSIKALSKIHLLGMATWGVLAGADKLHEPQIGEDVATYTPTPSNFEGVDYFLENHHTHFLLCDNGTHGHGKTEPLLQRKFEKYIRHKIHPNAKGSSTLVVVVLGGDETTIDKVAWAVENNICVIIVDGSGDVANMLAKMVQEIKDKDKNPEDERLRDLIEKYKDNQTKEKLIEFLKKSKLVKLWGTGRKEFPKSALSLSHDVWMTNLATEFEGLRKTGKNQNTNVFPPDIAELVGKSCDKTTSLAEKFSKVHWIRPLYEKLMSSDDAVSKVVHHLTGIRGHSKLYEGSESELTEEKKILPYVGKVIFQLLGDNYKVLYQEKEFSEDSPQGKKQDRAETAKGNSSTTRDSQQGKEQDSAETATENSSTKGSHEYCNLTVAMHLLFWAVLSNEKELAEVFLSFSKSKIGTALLVRKMFSQFAKTAENLRERNLKEELDENAQHFEGLAKDTLDKMYREDRYKAYRHLGAEVEFKIGKYLTPMSIAYDSGAEDFMSHPCCQTLLKLIWLNTMGLGTRPYQLMPWLIPLNIFYLVDFKNDFWRYALKPPPKVNFKDKNKSTISENTSDSCTTKLPSEEAEGKKEEIGFTVLSKTEEAKDFKLENARAFWISCTQRYFTAPVNKFAHSFVSYVILLVLFTHFVLTELKPLGPNGVKEVTLNEWLIYIWMSSIFCQELKQMFQKNISGPLYNMGSVNSEVWRKVWKWHERLQFFFRIYRLKSYIFDVWNAMDFLMIVFLGISVALRFTLDKKDFTVARICFCIVLLLYYWRFLRFGYVVKELGPRIVVIAKLLSDLGYFLVIMMVFIVSFGVAFQSLISPNEEPSWQLLSNVLWRGYWQMLGEIFIDDATEGMGLETTPRNCTTDRELARSYPDVYEHCHEWFLPVLLALFMMITNILLLNLLIAIFSRSFEDAEAKSMKIWQYHLYDLYHEYYSQVWMPPPLNLPWYLVKVLQYCIAKLQKCCKKTDTKRAHDLSKLASNMFGLDEDYREDEMETKKLQEVLKERSCDENKLKELETSVRESKIASEKTLQLVKDLEYRSENRAATGYTVGENTVGTQLLVSPASIDRSKTFT